MNKKDLKRFYFLTTIILIISIALNIIVNYKAYKKIEKNNNNILSTIIYNIKKEYPELNDEQIIHLLNTEKIKEYEGLEDYGILLKEQNISNSSKQVLNKCLLSSVGIIIIYFLIITIIMIIYNNKNINDIKKLTDYLKEINNNNYKLDIKSNEEGELSILQNEIYKTSIVLNEQAKNNKKDKEKLKDSLSDISHQLRTPLTSINLMIDNIVEGNLNKEEQRKQLTNINRKIKGTNFLIESLLKLSKFDANTIEFKNANYKINKILKSVENNLNDLLDLNEVELCVSGDNKTTLYCDYHWQIEALTNIVKNCIEHSEPQSKIEISYEESELLVKIIIKDHGKGMNAQDKKHIFDRFYKGENSNPNSIGIGMSLSKTIIEHNNGTITVDSKVGEGTKFTIKYLKNKQN